MLRTLLTVPVLAPVLATLASPETYHLDPHEGLGVVVPHRAQRASLQEELVRLMGPHSDLDEAVVTAVDTVERFQGGERIAILIGATESDPARFRNRYRNGTVPNR